MEQPEPAAKPSIGDRIPAPGYDLTFRFQEAIDLTEAEERALLDLLRVAFNGGPSWFSLVADPIDHLRWKFRDFPGTSQAELIEDGDRIVGMIITMRRRFLVRGNERISRDGADLAFHPSIQGRGVANLRAVEMAPVRKQMQPEVSFSWHQVAHPTARGRLARQGTLPVANYVETYLKPLSLRRLLTRSKRSPQATGPSRTRTMLESRKRRFQQLFSRARLGVRLVIASVRAATRRHPLGDVKLTTLVQFDDRANRFWELAAPAFDFIQVRNAEYLNWRFCDPRGGNFVVRAAEDDGHLLGYAATRVDEHEAVLADLLTLPERPDVVRALLADAINLARAHGAPVLRTWLPRTHPYHDALKEFGFVSAPAIVSLSYQHWRGDANEMAFLQNPSARVHLMNADTDHM